MARVSLGILHNDNGIVSPGGGRIMPYIPLLREIEIESALHAGERAGQKNYVFAWDGALTPARNGASNFTICAKIRGLAAITCPL